MRTSIKYSDKDKIISPKSYIKKGIILIKMFISLKLQLMQKSANKVLHSYNFFPSSLDKEINSCEAEIINLHWVQGEMISIESISRINKPIVWTLHDSWPFCGSEHYQNGFNDKRYIEGYKRNNRPPTSSGIDLDRYSWERKKRAWNKSFHIVCPSNWLAKCAKESYLFKDFDVSVIPNTLPLNIYAPWPKKESRKLFGLKDDLPIILFGSLSGSSDPRKGWDLLYKSLTKLEAQNLIFQIVILGQSEEKEKITLNSRITYIQRLEDDHSLALLYSASDLIVVPSRMENLPQMATEAQSCGVPVVGFNCTGLPDVVEHLKTGYLAEAYDTDELSRGISWILKDELRRKELGLNARKRALELWSETRIISEYEKIFSMLINKFDLKNKK